MTAHRDTLKKKKFIHGASKDRYDIAEERTHFFHRFKTLINHWNHEWSKIKSTLTLETNPTKGMLVFKNTHAWHPDHAKKVLLAIDKNHIAHVQVTNQQLAVDFKHPDKINENELDNLIRIIGDIAQFERKNKLEKSIKETSEQKRKTHQSRYNEESVSLHRFFDKESKPQRSGIHLIEFDHSPDRSGLLYYKLDPSGDAQQFQLLTTCLRNHGFTVDMQSHREFTVKFDIEQPWDKLEIVIQTFHSLEPTKARAQALLTERQLSHLKSNLSTKKIHGKSSEFVTFSGSQTDLITLMQYLMHKNATFEANTSFFDSKKITGIVISRDEIGKLVYLDKYQALKDKREAKKNANAITGNQASYDKAIEKIQGHVWRLEDAIGPYKQLPYEILDKKIHHITTPFVKFHADAKGNLAPLLAGLRAAGRNSGHNFHIDTEKNVLGTKVKTLTIAGDDLNLILNSNDAVGTFYHAYDKSNKEQHNDYQELSFLKRHRFNFATTPYTPSPPSPPTKKKLAKLTANDLLNKLNIEKNQSEN